MACFTRTRTPNLATIAAKTVPLVRSEVIAWLLPLLSVVVVNIIPKFLCPLIHQAVADDYYSHHAFANSIQSGGTDLLGLIVALQPVRGQP